MTSYKKLLKVHFIGVGGAGVSVLANLLLSKNFIVSGSDAVFSPVVDKLIAKGLKFNLGEDKSVVEEVDVVIYSSAISQENAELSRAKELKKALYTRAEFLSLVFSCYKKTVGISGSHGKTTATSMLSNVLKSANVNFTALIGGSDLTYGSFIFSPKNTALISEVCEFNKNIKNITTTLSVCLNVDNDHLDCYDGFEDLKNEFYAYLSRSKIKVICADDKSLTTYKNKGVITYGIYNKAVYFADNLVSKGGKYSFNLYYKGKFVRSFDLSVYGKHNVYNALSVIAVANSYFNLNFDTIYLGLKNFKGVSGRFEEISLCNKRIILDYAHHPTEIEKSLKTAKEVFNGEFITIFQPHTYSRTKLLFNDFIKVFTGYFTIIYKEYPARERYDKQGSAKRLSKNIENSVYIEDFNDLIDYIKQLNAENVLILGAGDLHSKIKNAE